MARLRSFVARCRVALAAVFEALWPDVFGLFLIGAGLWIRGNSDLALIVPGAVLVAVVYLPRLLGRAR